jgi:hypothetical protein
MFSRVQGQCFRWWRDIFFNERLRSIMIEEADEPDYEPIVWTLFEAAGLISIWKALRNRRKQMQSTAVTQRGKTQKRSSTRNNVKSNRTWISCFSPL